MGKPVRVQADFRPNKGLSFSLLPVGHLYATAHFRSVKSTPRHIICNDSSVWLRYSKNSEQIHHGEGRELNPRFLKPKGEVLWNKNVHLAVNLIGWQQIVNTLEPSSWNSHNRGQHLSEINTLLHKISSVPKFFHFVHSLVKRSTWNSWHS